MLVSFMTSRGSLVVLVVQDCIKIWAKLLTIFHEVFVLARLGCRVVRVAGRGWFRSNVQPGNIRVSPLLLRGWFVLPFEHATHDVRMRRAQIGTGRCVFPRICQGSLG